MNIKGMQITLIETIETSETDSYNRPITSTITSVIDNVVVGQPSADDVQSEINLSGKRIVYNLAIPKDDTHIWTNGIVEFYGRRYRVVGEPIQYMDGFMPKGFPWNKQVRVECYE